jgi:uncharacterized protein (TIGR02145 family)
MDTNTLTVSDADGNVYRAVQIGNQVWTAENLRTTKFNDGSPIPLVPDDDKAIWLAAPGYSWYRNDIANRENCGALYNWYAVSGGMLAPKGWHVPTDDEWTILQNHLIANGYNWDGTTVGNKVAKSLAGTGEWKSNPVSGATGNEVTSNNRSGFSALAGGCRDFNGFHFIGETGYWWSATESGAKRAYHRYLAHECEGLSRSDDSKKSGFSVRLLRD